MIDGNTLIAWGFAPERWIKDALATANACATAVRTTMRSSPPCRSCSRSKP